MAEKVTKNEIRNCGVGMKYLLRQKRINMDFLAENIKIKIFVMKHAVISHQISEKKDTIMVTEAIWNFRF